MQRIYIDSQGKRTCGIGLAVRAKQQEERHESRLPEFLQLLHLTG